MTKSTKARTPKVADVKITKKQVDAAIAAGNTHAKFMNKGVQKRLLKNQEKIRRAQQLQENQHKRRQKIVSGVMKNVAQSGGVVEQGAAALSQLVDAKADTVLQQLLDQKNPMTQQVKHSLAGEDPDGDIDPASIGGDLIDVDHDPSNFGVQGVNPDNEITGLGDSGENMKHIREGIQTLKAGGYKLDEEGLFRVPLYTGEQIFANRVMLNLYGDEQNYKPLPVVGDKIRDDGIVIALRDFGKVIPEERDMAALTDINYVFDTLSFGPAGEVVAVTETDIAIKPSEEAMQALASGKVRVTSEDIMNSRVHDDAMLRMYPPMQVSDLNAFAGFSEPSRKQMFRDQIPEIDVAATYPGPNTTPAELQAASASFSAQVEAAIQQRPELFTDLPPVKVLNSGISGVHINANAEAIHTSLTQEVRDRLHVSVEEVAAGLPLRPLKEESNKDDGAGDTSFSLKP